MNGQNMGKTAEKKKSYNNSTVSRSGGMGRGSISAPTFSSIDYEGRPSNGVVNSELSPQVTQIGMNVDCEWSGFKQPLEDDRRKAVR